MKHFVKLLLLSPFSHCEKKSYSASHCNALLPISSLGNIQFHFLKQRKSKKSKKEGTFIFLSLLSRSVYLFGNLSDEPESGTTGRGEGHGVLKLKSGE
jgi:hypothetical protein